MERKRIFLALPISEGLERLIFNWSKTYPNLPVRWVKGDNLHVTLVPPWYEENIGEVIQRLNIFENKPGGELVFNKVSFGPNPAKPRLIWAEGEASTAMHELRNNLLKMFDSTKPPLGPWKVHLTLARFKEENFKKFPGKNLNETVSWGEKINSFVLMESVLKHEGAEYKTLHKVSLA